MSSLGWLAQPAAFPWVALVFGLCIGSFLNVVIHRLPRMMEREWLGQVPEMLEEAEALRGGPGRTRVANEVRGLTRAALAGRLSLSFPRSHCPACGHRIGALQNIPVLSYLGLRGK
jgi:leader peptidase (prepilin peptidase)/N-methyltransferase